MRIQFSFVGQARMERQQRNEGDLWVEMDAVPREGEIIHLADVPESMTVVRTVIWYPNGSQGEVQDPTPFVYAVVGEPRPT